MSRRHSRTRLGISAGTFLAAGLFSITLPSHAEGGADSDRIEKGLRIAPVLLNMHERDRALVGLGSYIVNAQGGCNDCHTNPPYVSPGGDPYQGEKKKVNAAGYLGGGMAFGPFVSRNLTPTRTGLPAGDLTWNAFLKLMRTGLDPANEHPQFGPYLQVMPWPVYADMKESDLRAVYEYLGAIPCVEGGPGEPPNRCAR